MKPSPAERVANGIAYLDAHPAIPTNWRTLIDTNALDIGNSGWCVLGQLGPHVTDDDGEPFHGYGDLGKWLFGDEWLHSEDGEYIDAQYGFISATHSGVRSEDLTEAWELALETGSVTT